MERFSSYLDRLSSSNENLVEGAAGSKAHRMRRWRAQACECWCRCGKGTGAPGPETITRSGGWKAHRGMLGWDGALKCESAGAVSWDQSALLLLLDCSVWSTPRFSFGCSLWLQGSRKQGQSVLCSPTPRHWTEGCRLVNCYAVSLSQL